MEVQGRTFLITGGGSGLGAATARLLVRRGGRVVILDVDSAGGAALAGELGDAAAFVRADVTDRSQTQAAIAAAAEFSGGDGLRGLIGCAGIAPAERVVSRNGEPHPLDVFQRAIAVNLVGTFNALRLAAAAMAGNAPLKDGERGVIVNTASIAAFEGQIGQAAYAASKGGVASMTLPIARELARHGVRVVTIAPGVFETPMVAGMPENVRQALSASAPFPPRLGRPEEYAQLACHVLENPMINGAILRLDGALRLPCK